MKIINWTKCGFTLFETILVLSIFSIIGLMITTILASSIRSVKKSQNLIKVKTATSRAVDVIERQLRVAKNLSCTVDNHRIDFTDERGKSAYFAYDGSANIASGSASPAVSVNLNPEEVTITSASFACSVDALSEKTIVDVVIEATLTGQPTDSIETATVDLSTKIVPRNK